MRAYRADNPPDGAVITYYLHQDVGTVVTVEIRDANGKVIRNLTGPGGTAIHRVVWDLKTNETAALTRQRRGGPTPSEWEYAQKVSPGRYGLKLTAGTQAVEGFITVRAESGKAEVASPR